MGSGDISMNPKVLVLKRIADTTAAAFYDGEEGSLAYDNNTNKLGFITAAGASEETVTSG